MEHNGLEYIQQWLKYHSKQSKWRTDKQTTLQELNFRKSFNFNDHSEWYTNKKEQKEKIRNNNMNFKTEPTDQMTMKWTQKMY